MKKVTLLLLLALLLAGPTLVAYPLGNVTLISQDQLFVSYSETIVDAAFANNILAVSTQRPYENDFRYRLMLYKLEINGDNLKFRAFGDYAITSPVVGLEVGKNELVFQNDGYPYKFDFSTNSFSGFEGYDVSSVWNYNEVEIAGDGAIYFSRVGEVLRFTEKKGFESIFSTSGFIAHMELVGDNLVLSVETGKGLTTFVVDAQSDSQKELPGGFTSALSPNGKLLASPIWTANQYQVLILDMSGNLKSTTNLFGPFPFLDFFADSNHLLVADKHQFFVVNAQNGRFVSIDKYEADGEIMMANAAGNKYLVTIDSQGWRKLWQLPG